MYDSVNVSFRICFLQGKELFVAAKAKAIGSGAGRKNEWRSQLDDLSSVSAKGNIVVNILIDRLLLAIAMMLARRR